MSETRATTGCPQHGDFCRGRDCCCADLHVDPPVSDRINAIDITARHGVAEVTVHLPDPTLGEIVEALLTHVLPGLGFANVERQVAELFGPFPQEAPDALG